MGTRRPAVENRRMDSALILLLLAGLADSAALYGMLIVRRVHQRRVDVRLQQSVRLYGLVRVVLADRRAVQA
jgi:hypothetical protein